MTEEPLQTDVMLREIARAADAKKAEDIVILKLSGISSITDYFLICSGQSIRQCQTITDAIEENLSGAGVKPLSVEGKAAARWILMDYGDVIVHIFQQETRDFFDLERLWGDADQVSVEELLGEND